MHDTKSSEPGDMSHPEFPTGPRRPRARSARRTVRLAPDFRPSDAYRRVLDSLQEHVAVVDHRGTILAVNKAWKEFARRNGDPLLHRSGVGSNYFDVCRAATGEDVPIARRAAAGIRAVMRGTQKGFALEYPCHSPRQHRWFLMYASRVALPTPGAVVSHVNITRRREAEEAVRRARTRLEDEVRRRTQRLARTNATLEEEVVHRLQAERRLRENERRLQEALRDQERISQDLHDSVLQALYAIGLGLQSSEPVIAGTSEEAAAVVKAAIQQLNFVIREVRGYIAGIESTLLKGGDVVQGIQALVELLGRQSRVEFSLSLSQAAVRHLSREEARNLLQIVSEAIGNVVRHAHARHVWVRLHRQGSRFRLEVRDDGVGMAKERWRQGRGLKNMARRAKSLGGRLWVASEPEQGTRVTVEAPLQKPKPAGARRASAR